MDDKFANSKPTKRTHQARVRSSSNGSTDEENLEKEIKDFMDEQQRRFKKLEMEGSSSAHNGDQQESDDLRIKMETEIKEELPEDEKSAEQSPKKSSKAKKSKKTDSKKPIKFSKEGISSRHSSDVQQEPVHHGLQSPGTQSAPNTRARQKLTVDPIPRNAYQGYVASQRKAAARKAQEDSSEDKIAKRLRSRDPQPTDIDIPKTPQVPGLAETLIRGAGFSLMAAEASERQITVARTLLRNLTKQNAHFNELEVNMDNFMAEVKELKGRPDEVACIRSMVNNLSFQFGLWILKGNRLTVNAQKPIKDIENANCLLNEMSNDMYLYFNSKKHKFADIIDDFEAQLIESANKIGMHVVTSNGIKARISKKPKYMSEPPNFKNFMTFYRVFLYPYCATKKLSPFFCTPCNGVALTKKEVVENQDHLKDQIFSLSFMSDYATVQREDNHQQVKNCFKEFKAYYFKGLPKQKDPHMNRQRTLEGLGMPSLMIPGHNGAKNVHTCFTKATKRQHFDKLKQRVDDDPSNYEESNHTPPSTSKLFESTASSQVYQESSDEKPGVTRVRTNSHSGSHQNSQAGEKTKMKLRGTGAKKPNTADTMKLNSESSSSSLRPRTVNPL